MYRYVLVRKENYEEYVVQTAYPIVVAYRRRELIDDARRWWEGKVPSYVDRSVYSSDKKYETFPIAGTPFVVDFLDLTKQTNDTTVYEFEPPEILSVEEFFDKYQNRDVNNI